MIEKFTNIDDLPDYVKDPVYYIQIAHSYYSTGLPVQLTCNKKDAKLLLGILDREQSGKWSVHIEQNEEANNCISIIQIE